MAGRERDWMDYAQLGSSLAHNAQLSSIGDQLAALKQAESQKQFAEFEVSVIRQILFRIEDRIRFFTKQPSFSPQGRMLALMKLAEVLASFNEPSFYRNYEDKDRHTALTTKVDEAVMEIARSLSPSDLAEFNEAVAWRTKLPLLAQAMQLSRDTEEYRMQIEKRPQLEAQHQKWKDKWQADKDALEPKLAPLEKELIQLKSQIKEPPDQPPNGLIAFLCLFLPGIGWIVPIRWVVKSNAIKVQSRLRERADVVQAKITSILPPKPIELPEPPSKPANAAAEQFLLDEKLGSSFEELETAFTEKRALVERVLDADAGLQKELTDLDARALLHRTAQEVATKMGLPLPPQLASGAAA